MTIAKFIPLKFCLISLAIFMGTLRGMDDPDLWYQLLAGREFIAKHAVPHSDFYVYAGWNAPQMFGGWGFGTIYQLFVENFGFSSASFLNSAIWCSAFSMGISAGIMRTRAKLDELTLTQWVSISVVVMLLFIAISPRVGMRAESIIWLGWSATLLLYEWSRQQNKIHIFLLGAPIISWGVSMLHTGGFLLFGVFLICLFLENKHQKLSRKQWLLWISSFFCVALLPVINPNGFDQPYIQLRSIVDLLLNANIQSPSTQGMTIVHAARFDNLEYLPIWDGRASSQRPLFALAGFSLVLIAFNYKRTIKFELLTCLIFFIMGALHTRGLGFACLAMLTPACSAAAVGEQRKSSSSIILKILFPIILITPLGYSAATSRLSIQGEIPMMKMVNVIKNAKPQGANIFTMESGHQLAYLLGDKYKVSSASHSLMVNARLDEHVRNVMLDPLKWEEEFTKHNVEFVCLPLYVPTGGGGAFYYLPNELVVRNNWLFHPSDSACNLFEQLSDDKLLSTEQVQQQTLAYLQNLYIISEVSYRGQGDLVGKNVAEQARKKIDQIKAEMDYGKSISTTR